MRIALISQEYPPETAKGGLGTQTFVKAHGLARRGHEVYVISRSTNGAPRAYWDGPVHVTRIAGFETSVALYTEVADWITYSAQVNVALAARHAATPLDLVDFPEWGAEGYVYLLNQTEWNRTPTVVHLHGPLVLFAHEMHWPPIDSEFYRTGTMLESTCLRIADALCTSSRYSADYARRRYQLQHGEIPVIHTGVDTDHFSPSGEALPERPTIVFAGKLVENKGVFQVVEAALELARDIPDLHVRLLGRAEDSVATELQRRAVAAGRPALLELAGFVPHEELPSHFNRAHVFAMPAPHEPGPGLVYLEAMACGLPVIACAGSGAEESIAHEDTGLLVPPGDTMALVAALRRLLTDMRTRAEMGANARRYIVDNADSRDCLDRLERFYESVVQRHLNHARPGRTAAPCL